LSILFHYLSFIEMDQATAIETIKTLLPTMRETRDPGATLLKHATAKNLAPAQLEKLGHVFNTLKSITFFDKNPDNRGGYFSLMDVPELVTKYAEFRPTKGNHAPRAVRIEGDIDGWLDNKAASARFPKQGEKAASEEPEQWKFAAAPEPSVADTFEVLSQIVDDYRDQFEKAATSIENAIRESRANIQDLETVAIQLHGTAGKSAFARLYSRLENSACPFLQRLEKEPRATKLAQDRSGLLAEFEKCKEAIEIIDGAEREGAHKLAATQQSVQNQPRTETDDDYYDDYYDDYDDDRSQDYRGQPRGATSDDDAEFDYWDRFVGDPGPKNPHTPEEAFLEGLDKGKGFGPSVQSLGALHPRDVFKGVFGDGPSKKREKSMQNIDETVGDEEALVTLSQLILRDPILSQKDPEVIVDLFNTLRTANPQIASDPNLARLVLREAMEYGSLPLHQIKDISETNYNRPNPKKEDNKSNNR
jgi:hypothetical protein